MSVEDIQARIDRLSAEIERHKDAIDQLEHSKSAAQRELNAIHDPVARLPLEISSEIFLQCLSFSLEPKPLAAPMLLLNICNAWTNIALSTPALWTAISNSFPCDELLQAWLQRARAYPLSVVIVGYVEDRVRAILGKYSTQFKHLEIFSEEPHLDPFLAIGPFPCLETLEIGSFSEDSDEPYDVSMTQIIDLLRLAPNLVECTFNDIPTIPDHGSVTEVFVTVPKLQALMFGKTTNLSELESHDDILCFITLPALTTLFLSLDFIAIDHFLLFLERSLPPLKKLGMGLGCLNCPFVELKKCLRLVPSLTHLELCIASTDLLLALASFPSDFLPNLQSLKIRHSFETVAIGTDAVYQAILDALSNRRTQLRNFDFRGDAIGPLAHKVYNALKQLCADGAEIYIGTDDYNLLDVGAL
ncbi:hypothetical protein B0H16DRAFT_1407893 [Mycena metata]|uniref:F-box domain-containing protein n=1 Tax=Mycena metata TaxID=1033252 RepID=A0AAD7K1A7_9AGAR|nr:hypothetical protein B0H16DRAFT_1407893 [Mycena metata]